jgi:hypothetical protein
MSLSSKPIIYLGMAIMVGLFFANFLAIQEYATKKHELQVVADRLSESQSQIEEIRRLENQPRKASLTKETPAEITSRVDRASQEVGVNARKVSPGELVPEKDSSYSRRDSTVTFDALTLPQVIQFSQMIEEAEAGLSVREITLKPNTIPNAIQELWQVNLTLTQLIFSPKS